MDTVHSILAVPVGVPVGVSVGVPITIRLGIVYGVIGSIFHQESVLKAETHLRSVQVSLHWLQHSVVVTF